MPSSNQPITDGPSKLRDVSITILARNLLSPLVADLNLVVTQMEIYGRGPPSSNNDTAPDSSFTSFLTLSQVADLADVLIGVTLSDKVYFYDVELLLAKSYPNEFVQIDAKLASVGCVEDAIKTEIELLQVTIAKRDVLEQVAAKRLIQEILDLMKG